jgi:hypothetical protein
MARRLPFCCLGSRLPKWGSCPRRIKFDRWAPWWNKPFKPVRKGLRWGWRRWLPWLRRKLDLRRKGDVRGRRWWWGWTKCHVTLRCYRLILTQSLSRGANGVISYRLLIGHRRGMSTTLAVVTQSKMAI